MLTPAERERANLLYDTLVRISNPCEELVYAAQQAGVFSFSDVSPQQCHFAAHAERQCMLMTYLPTGKPIFIAMRDSASAAPLWIHPRNDNVRVPYGLQNDEAWPWGHHQAVYDGPGMLDALRLVFTLLPAPRDLFAARLVCRQWRDAHDHDSPMVHERWRQFIAEVQFVQQKVMKMERQWHTTVPVPMPPPWARYAQYAMLGVEKNPHFTAGWWFNRIFHANPVVCDYYDNALKTIALAVSSANLAYMPTRCSEDLCFGSVVNSIVCQITDQMHLPPRVVAQLHLNANGEWTFVNVAQQTRFSLTVKDVIAAIAAFRRYMPTNVY